MKTTVLVLAGAIFVIALAVMILGKNKPTPPLVDYGVSMPIAQAESKRV